MVGLKKQEFWPKINIPLRRVKVVILTFSLMYLINNVHVAASGIQLSIPLKPAASSNLLINRLEEAAGYRGIGSWIPEVATCTLLIRYIRENFKIATFSHLSGT